jgi:SlyX protein
MSNENDSQVEVLDDLQTRLAFQDQAINDLNDVIADQQKQISLLQDQLKLLHDRLGDLSESVESSHDNSKQDEKPPHY